MLKLSLKPLETGKEHFFIFPHCQRARGAWETEEWQFEVIARFSQEWLYSEATRSRIEDHNTCQAFLLLSPRKRNGGL
jgi:hypothetical protein